VRDHTSQQFRLKAAKLAVVEHLDAFDSAAS
jgi:hypothetical protein